MLLEPKTEDSSAARYAAFISYSHHDRKTAVWLHRALETYRLPRDVAGEGRQSLRPIFLDRAELPSSADLASSVRIALEASDFLIVVCSPAAAKSRWVNEEIRVFKSLGRSAQMLALVVAGEPGQLAGSAPGMEDCLPAAMRYVTNEAGEITTTPAVEPLAADIRPGMDDRRLAMLKIAAGMLRVPLDQLVQRDSARRQRRLMQIASAAVVGCMMFAALAIFAVHSRNEAEQQRRVAVQQSLTAQRTVGFLKSLFAVSDPSEARGKTITAREVLDRGVSQINTQLRDEPAVRADLTTTLGEVYTSLGLLHEGSSLLKGAQAIPALSPALSARQAAAMGDVQFQEGDLPAALNSLQHALSLLDQSAEADPGLRVRILNRLGDVLRDQGQFAAAREKFHEVLVLVTAPRLADPALWAAAEEGIAQCDQEEHRYSEAERGFQQALARQISVTGEMHPRVAEMLNELGTVKYLQGDRRGAADYFQRTLVIDRKILGDRHPDVTATMNNLARVLLEQRRFAEARALLEQSLQVLTAEVSDNDANMAFVYSNLALARMGSNDFDAARQLFEKGLRNAVLNKHRLHGPILTDLADLECRTGQVQEGLAHLAEAQPIVAERYPDDPWRLAYLNNVRGGCLTRLKRFAEAETLFTSSMPVLQSKWPADTLYGYDALQRTMQLYSLTGNAAKLGQYRRLAEQK